MWWFRSYGPRVEEPRQRGRMLSSWAFLILGTYLLSWSPAGAQVVHTTSGPIPLSFQLENNREEMLRVRAERPSNRAAVLLCVSGAAVAVAGGLTVLVTALVELGSAGLHAATASEESERQSRAPLIAYRTGAVAAGVGGVALLSGTAWALALVPARRPYNRRLRELGRERRELTRSSRVLRTDLVIHPSVSTHGFQAFATLRF